MNENDVMKALKICSRPRTVDCYKCPLYKLGIQDCNIKLSGLALDLINRLKAENERLKDYEALYKNLREEHLEIIKAIKFTKSEARKELAERLKELTFFVQDEEGFENSVVLASDIDNLLAEMENKGV